jgi:hypothetical protein
LSPVLTATKSPWSSVEKEKENPFGGFSYVASQSLLEANGFAGMAGAGLAA